MRRIIPAIATVLLALAGLTPAVAQDAGLRPWIDTGAIQWTETVDVGPDGIPAPDLTDTNDASAPVDGERENARGGDRLLMANPSEAPTADSVRRSQPIARFGPFAVLDGEHAMLTRETDTAAPAHFLRMLAAYPGIRVLELYDCPGTLDDNANLVLGKMIHARGMATDVPPGGSVRSGAVDLFLAGVRRTAAADATFAVHAWLDEEGLRPSSFAASSPVNRKYVLFYHEMGGMPLDTARAFYDLTNSVPNEQALWLTVRDIARFAAVDIR